MPQYVDPAVERLRDSDDDSTVTVLLGTGDDRASLIEALERVGATVENELGRATVRATVTERAVDDLCEIQALTSIELERDDVRTLDEGNSNSRRRVTR